MPRTRTSEAGYVKRLFVIHEELDAKVRLALFDPYRGKPKHGAMSALVNQLLSEWIKKHGRKSTDTPAATRASWVADTGLTAAQPDARSLGIGGSFGPNDLGGGPRSEALDQRGQDANEGADAQGD